MSGVLPKVIGDRVALLPPGAPAAILELDREGRIVRLDRGVAGLFGYDAAELFRQPVGMLIPAGLSMGYLRHRMRSGRAHDLQLEGCRKDGSYFPLEISFQSDSSPRSSSSGTTLRDVTERLQIEMRLRVVQEGYVAELETRNQQLEQADRLKTDLLANMSHELRSPLHSVLGFTELLAEEKEGPLGDRQKLFLSYIHRDALDLLDLVNDLLDLTKMEAGLLELRYEAICVASILEETISSFQPRAAAKSVQIYGEFSTPAVVMGDHLRIKQILNNLLSNAVKFTPVGGEIRVEAVPRDGFAEVSISDTGKGIPEDQQGAVFDRFYQIRSAAELGNEGTGLGLAITKRLVEQHGGRIWLRSAVGVGSCFLFTLPLSG